MDETVIVPSPNWFQVSVMAVSVDGWIIYGGPCKSLCVLEPIPLQHDGILSGSQGYHAHSSNWSHVERISNVDISPEWPEKRAILTGSFDGSVKEWSLEKEEKLLNLKVAHSHSVHSKEKEEIAGVGYSTATTAITVGCYGNIVKWDLNSNVVKTYNNVLKIFKPVCMSCSPHIPQMVAIGTKQGVVFVVDVTADAKLVYKVRGQDDEIVNVSWCPQYEVIIKKSLSELERRLEKIKQEANANDSAIAKSLPEDSFDESVVVEDDMFDIYKDHEEDEFGHKKYIPEEVRVKIKVKEEVKEDYLAECLKLKEQILQMKNEPEPSIESLVEALDKSHVHDEQANSSKQDNKEVEDVYSAHVHKHLLASIGKLGGVRIWSKSGKLVSSCAVPNGNKNQKGKSFNWATLLWYKPDCLLIADGKGQLLECNPLQIDCKSKLEWKVLHNYHKRGLYCIASNIPRCQAEGTDLNRNWSVLTVAQDRNIVNYSMDKREMISIHNTCGGFLYDIKPCPYDAKKIAISVGDGAVRVWETDVLEDDETKLTWGNVKTFWQNVQGKVLTVAWHPTKENMLAFGTAETRVGIIDTSGKQEKARVLVSSLRGAAYSLCWGQDRELYACGGGDLVLYHTERQHDEAEPLKVSVEGRAWEVSAVQWDDRALLCGSWNGAVAALHPYTRDLCTVAYVFSKMIHSMEWHPQQTTNSSEESPYKNLIAVSSLDKSNDIAILEYGVKEDGGKQLQIWKKLSGHKGPVLQLAWNPHVDGQLLSTSQDSTVRMWEAGSGVCVSIFGGHTFSSLGVAWSPFPQWPRAALSGGADCCLRLFDTAAHPADAYTARKRETTKTEKKKIKEKEPKSEENKEEAVVLPEVPPNRHSSPGRRLKYSKRFLLPFINKQMHNSKIQAVRKMVDKCLAKESDGNGIENEKQKPIAAGVSNNASVSNGDSVNGSNGENKSDSTTENGAASTSDVQENNEEYDLDYLKLFGTTNEFNAVLDMEMQNHLAHDRLESWMMLNIFRGHMDTVMQYASENDMLCPFLLSLAPCVSFKYWKDVTQMYLAQINRLVAKGEEEKLNVERSWGGATYRAAALQLAAHDARAAVAALADRHLFREAYVLCRCRHLDSIAEEILRKWIKDSMGNGTWHFACIGHLVLGQLYEAATILGQLKDEDCLSLAAELAKASGQMSFAEHITDKKSKIEKPVIEDTPEALRELPSRLELLMKEKCVIECSPNGHEEELKTNGNGTAGDAI